MTSIVCEDCGHELELVQKITWTIDPRTGKAYNPFHTHYTRCPRCGNITSPNIIIPVVTTYGG